MMTRRGPADESASLTHEARALSYQLRKIFCHVKLHDMYLFGERKCRILALVRDLKCGDLLVIICLLSVDHQFITHAATNVSPALPKPSSRI
jgi:hypothetical protein